MHHVDRLAFFHAGQIGKVAGLARRLGVLEDREELGVGDDKFTCAFGFPVFGFGLEVVGLDVIPKFLGDFGPWKFLGSQETCQVTLDFHRAIESFFF